MSETLDKDIVTVQITYNKKTRKAKLQVIPINTKVVLLCNVLRSFLAVMEEKIKAKKYEPKYIS